MFAPLWPKHDANRLSELRVALAEGRMNPMLAMAMGKFKIQGDLGLAMKLQQVFKRQD